MRAVTSSPEFRLAGRNVVVREAMFKREGNMAKKELLNRSIVAENVEPIKFGEVVRAFGPIQNTLGKIGCRDLGPRKYILSFESIEQRDMALTEPGLNNMFDEMRPY
ncbi:hypothetical protein PIB30_056277 [Stylosanthes scabra]|uniref:Uncharacterized protein n=1 Tax=Stylosanthes scabra TaxID=79078 RepID=A0ABU6UI33_9FABA|nr:hypothetical protein [Stylosanthes scabra]